MGESLPDRVEVELPPEVVGKAMPRAHWNYRRVSPDASLALAGEVRPLPVMAIGKGEVAIDLRPAT